MWKYIILLSAVALSTYSYAADIVVLEENDAIPSKIKLQKRDGSVFFFNNSNQLLRLEIAWSKKRAHCASSNMTYEDGKIIAPKLIKGDFAITCFPQSGDYSFTTTSIGGLGQKNQTTTSGVIKVRSND